MEGTMRLVTLALIASTAGTIALLDAQEPAPLYRQSSASVETRVTDLLARMTLEEKVAQLLGIWNRKREIEDAQGRFDATNAKALIGFGIGEVARPSEIARPNAGSPVRQARGHALFVNALQKWLIENTRLGIPAMFHEEALHGLTGEHVGSRVGRAAHERGGTRSARAWHTTRALSCG
jgi:beta-glucosidase